MCGSEEEEEKPGFCFSGDFLFSPFLRGLLGIIFWGFLRQIQEKKG